MSSGSIVNNSAPSQPYSHNFTGNAGGQGIWPKGTRAYASPNGTKKGDNATEQLSNGSELVYIGDRADNLWAEQ
jgi:hypothetical protein